MNKFEQIGTVEILQDRIYRIDPMNHDDLIGTQAIVRVGTYPLLSDGMTYVWMMTGEIDGNSIRRGDGLFVIASGGDSPLEGLVVTFPSKFLGRDEWKDLLGHPISKPGPEQRIRVTITTKEDQHG